MTNEGQPRETEIWMPPSVPFYFDPESMEFIFGFSGAEEHLSTKDMEDVWDIGSKISNKTKDISPNAPETLVIPSFPSPIVMASARKPLFEIANEEKVNEEISQRVRDVLRAVYHEAASDIRLPRPSNRQDLWSFGVNFSQNGEFTVRTFGNCACMGPNPHPTFLDVESGSSSKNISLPFELGFHNADSRAQRLSLLAGAGTIGFITKQMLQA